MRTFDKFMYLFVCFTICWTKVIQPHKLMYDGCNLPFFLIILVQCFILCPSYHEFETDGDQEFADVAREWNTSTH